MDTLYMFMGALCLAEGICLFTGKDFLMFMGSTKKEDYNLDKVFQVEKWIFLVDAACSLGVGMNRFPDVFFMKDGCCGKSAQNSWGKMLDLNKITHHYLTKSCIAIY